MPFKRPINLPPREIHIDWVWEKKAWAIWLVESGHVLTKPAVKFTPEDFKALQHGQVFETEAMKLEVLNRFVIVHLLQTESAGLFGTIPWPEFYTVLEEAGGPVYKIEFADPEKA